MATSTAVYGRATNSPMTPRKSADPRLEESRCAVCQQVNCDVQILNCGCLLHTTCLPLDILFVKQPMRMKYANQHAYCPCCRRSPIVQIRVLPLPMAVLEEATQLREKDSEIFSIHNNDAASLACGSPANSIALFNGTSKRAFASKSAVGRSYRTGRWASEESAYTDKLIKSFDAGLLPLPHGIKLNDFLCELLSCRTSRLTKKLKNAKLSARTYRSWASTGNSSANAAAAAAGGAFSSNYVGGDIQRTQTLFLKTITPEWVRMELQFNISRMWRTHLANFCLQISYLNLDTKKWFASLDAVDYVAMSCNDTKLQARKKRMRSALTEDANAAARTAVQPPANDAGSIGNDANTNISGTSSDKEGVFVGGLPFQRLSSMNLKSMADVGDEIPETLSIKNDATDNEDEISQYRGRVDSISESTISRDVSTKLVSSRKFSFETSVLEQSMKHSGSLSSFVELFTPHSKPPSRKGSIDMNAPSINAAENGNKNEEFELSATTKGQPVSEVDNIIDEAIDSVLESPSSEKDYQGLFLQELSKFLAESDSPFQHVDLWVPMDVSHSDIIGKKHIGGASTIATTSSRKVTGIIYGGGQQESSVRLSNAGYTTIRAPPQIMNCLNEFGMYSKNFSFSPGFGMPGRVFLSRIPTWETNLSMLNPEQFARVGGSKIYGVNTSLCLPVFTPIGTMVVGLYSTQNLGRDVSWEKKCMEYCWKLKPEPKWKLTIDVGLKIAPQSSKNVPSSQASRSSPRIAPTGSQAFVIPPSPKASKSSERLQPPQTSNPTLNAPHCGTEPSNAPISIYNEQSLALLLGKYMPLDRNSSQVQHSSNPANDQDVAGNLMSLRLLLLRHSSCRANAESKMVEVIMRKYHEYLRANKQEHDLILSVVDDWKRLAAPSSSANANEAQSKSHFYNSAPAAKRAKFGGQPPSSFTSGVGFLGGSTVPSPLPNPFVPSAETTQGSQRAPIPQANEFGTTDFGLPLTSSFGNRLQTAASVAGSASWFDGSRRQLKEQNNVPRVVSEQGPIEKNEASGICAGSNYVG